VDGVKEWVRGLVLLVLVGSLLELLLPMNSMKKYVRMTIGLLVMLSVTKPILGFLGQPVTVNTTFLGEQADQRLPSIGEIMAQAETFRKKNEALAAGEAEAGLAMVAEEAAREVPGVAEATADVAVRESSGNPEIRSVTVTVRPGAAGGVAPVPTVQPVEPVKPVGKTDGLPPSETPPAGPPRLTAAEQKLADAVRQQVAARLGLKADPAVIRVVIRSGSEQQRR
jgi:stage III sporulation protein AF